jgi:hypothetical protein
MCIAPLSLRPERSRAKKALLPFGGLPLKRQSLSRDRESLPFMCLSVSGRLRLRRSSSKGLSPDSSYRDQAIIHEIVQIGPHPRHTLPFDLSISPIDFRYTLPDKKKVDGYQ